MGEFMGLLIGIVLGAIVGGLVIWIVAKLNLGLEVDGFASAFIAAIVIAVISGVIYWLLGLMGIALDGGWMSALISLIISAVVLMFGASMLPGLSVAGFTGALIAAISMGIVYWLIDLVVGMFA